MQIRQNPLFVAHRSAARLSDLQQKLDRATEVALTGSDVHRPSDAPGAWGKLHGLASERADQDVWMDGVNHAQDLLDTAESALSAASNLVQQAWERAVQLSSDSYGTEERTAAASEIAGLRDDLLGLANTKLDQQRIFAGDAFNADAFDATGTYQGTTATGTIQIGEQQQVGATFDGSQVFQGDVDIFAVLSNLENALAADDAAGVAATLDDLDAGSRQLVSARQEVGYRRARTEDAFQVAQNLSLMLDQRLTDAVSVDPAEAFTNLAQLQTSYQAALQVTASTGSGSKLFDFIR
ncbi:MAG: hypothetical protein KC621_30420 [Myxococcales bacterium]|nr:hypothetical protein [Myxococcales bacterium]